jgi:hypothetical protein
MVIRSSGRGARVSAELQRKVQKPVHTAISRVLWHDAVDDDGSRVLELQHRRLPVCPVAASSRPRQVSLFSICSVCIPLISAAFQKPSLDTSTMRSTRSVTLHFALAIGTLPRLVVAPYLAFSLAQRRHWRSPWPRVHFGRLRDFLTSVACSAFIGLIAVLSHVCELLEVKEGKRAKALTSGQAGAGASPKNPAVRSSLLRARLLLCRLVALFFRGFP